MTAVFFFSSRRRHTRLQGDWSSDVCSSDLTSTLRSEGLMSLGEGEGDGAAAGAGAGEAEAAVPPLEFSESLMLLSFLWANGFRRGRRVGWAAGPARPAARRHRCRA